MNSESQILETPCRDCNGCGNVTECGRNYRCDSCDGAGFVPTQAGARILALMRHNFKPIQKDLHEDYFG